MDDDLTFLNGAWDAMTHVSSVEVDDKRQEMSDDSVLDGLLFPGLTRHDALVRVVNKELEQRQSILQMEREIAETRRGILTLRAMHNSLLIIRHLPDEVLAHVFYFASQGDGLADGESPQGSSHACVKLTHVCRHWRSVALATPRLWSCIDLVHLGSVATFLRRSKLAPLCLFAYGSWDSQSKIAQVVKVIAENLERCRWIDFRVDQSSCRTISAYLMAAPAPILESFTFKCTANILIDYNTDFSYFSDQTPALRRLHLDRVSVPWDSPIFTRGLTHLSVFHQLSYPSLERFFAILQSCPQLIELRLVGAGPEYDLFDPPESLPPLPIVSLPHLRTLVLDKIPADIGFVLSHLSTPARMELRWDFSQTVLTPDLIELLPRDISSLPAFTGIRSLYYQGGFTTQCYGTRQPDHVDQSAKIDLVILYTNIGMIFPSLEQAFPLTMLESLTVRLEAETVHVNSWMVVLGHLPALRELAIRTRHFLPPLQALFRVIPTNEMHDDDDDVSTCLPHLQKLSLSTGFLNQTSMDTLLLCLTARRASPATTAMRILHFEQCTLENIGRIVRDDDLDDYGALLNCLVKGKCQNLTIDFEERIVSNAYIFDSGPSYN